MDRYRPGIPHDLVRISREWSRLLDSPAMRHTQQLIREAERQLAMVELVVPPALAELQASVAHHHLRQSSLLEATRRLLEAQDALKNVQVPRVPSELLRVAERVRELQCLASPALAEVAENVSRALASSAFQAHFQATAIGELLNQLHRAETARTSSEADEFLVSVLEWVQEQIKSLPPSWVSFKGMVWLIFTVVLPLYTLVDSKIAERRDIAWRERHSSEVQRRFDDIAAQLETLRPPIPPQRLHLVTKRLRVRAGPSTDAPVVGILVPNDLIQEIERRGHWLHVEYFDYSEGIPETAWLYKRYVVPVLPTEEAGELGGEPFIGMWSDRDEMGDSTAWVRRIREDEWAHERE